MTTFLCIITVLQFLLNLFLTYALITLLGNVRKRLGTVTNLCQSIGRLVEYHGAILVRYERNIALWYELQTGKKWQFETQLKAKRQKVQTEIEEALKDLREEVDS